MILRYEKNGKTIKSAPWCFEAMCLVDDNRCDNIVKMCSKAVEYLFESEDITLSELTASGRLLFFCLDVFKQYQNDINIISVPGTSSGNSSRLRDVYKMLFDAWGILPSDAAIQEPRIFLQMLTQKDDSTAATSTSVDLLYGL